MKTWQRGDVHDRLKRDIRQYISGGSDMVVCCLCGVDLRAPEATFTKCFTQEAENGDFEMVEEFVQMRGKE